MRITRVTTRTGDDGTTGLAGGQRVSKDSVRIEACGDVDELSSWLGAALALGLDGSLEEAIRRVQHDLFSLGSDLAVLEEDRERFGVPHIRAADVQRLETETAELQEALGVLPEFLLPGGAPAAALLHVARAVCRRAERRAVALCRESPLDPHVLSYLNRLSDLLFVMARQENRLRNVSDVFWKKPRGGEAAPG